MEWMGLLLLFIDCELFSWRCSLPSCFPDARWMCEVWPAGTKSLCDF